MHRVAPSTHAGSKEETMTEAAESRRKMKNRSDIEERIGGLVRFVENADADIDKTKNEIRVLKWVLGDPGDME